MRVQYLLPLWLSAGTLVANDAVKQMLVYEYLLGCERCGVAIDCLLAHWNDNKPVSPSVLRKFFITTAVRLRSETPATFTITPACMLLVGGAADDAEIRALAAPMATPACMPVWMRTVQYHHLLPPDGTFITLCELETAWWPRLFPNQRSDGGCFTIFEGMLRDTLSASEQAVFARMAAATLSAHYCQLMLTLLPTSPELLSFPLSPAGAALMMIRNFTRAISAGGALVVSIQEVQTTVLHYSPFDVAIGTEVGAPATLGLLQDLVRTALRSPSATLTLGNIAQAAEQYKYLAGRVRDLRSSGRPASDLVAFLLTELTDRRDHVAMGSRSTRRSAHSAAAHTDGST